MLAITQLVFKFYAGQKAEPSLSHSSLHLWHTAQQLPTLTPNTPHFGKDL